MTLIASDGYVESRVSFEIVVTNRNIAPILASVQDISTREGDSIAIRLQAVDEDGDRIRYRSPNLPRGPFSILPMDFLNGRRNTIKTELIASPSWQTMVKM